MDHVRRDLQCESNILMNSEIKVTQYKLHSRKLN